MVKSLLISLYIRGKIGSRSRNSVSSIFFLNQAASKHRLLKALLLRWHFIMTRPWVYKMPSFILKSVVLAKPVKSFISSRHFRFIGIWRRKIVFRLHSFSFSFAKFSLLVLKLGCFEIEISIVINVLSWSRLSCFLGIQMIIRSYIRVRSSQHRKLGRSRG